MNHLNPKSSCRSNFSLPTLLAVATALLLSTVPALRAAIIDFTGGTVNYNDGANSNLPTTGTTNNSVNFYSATSYVQGGFVFSFIGGEGSVGDYYGTGNDVIHGHWGTGGYGSITSMTITKSGGGTFDLGYFLLTSNTDMGGGPASGNEQTFIQGFNGLTATGPALQLPSNDWGFPATQIYLGSAFDLVDKVVFTVGGLVDCFGMDSFYIDETSLPLAVPEPSSYAMVVGLGALGFVINRRRRTG
jgi:hypothetical protein